LYGRKCKACSNATPVHTPDNLLVLAFYCRWAYAHPFLFSFHGGTRSNTLGLISRDMTLPPPRGSNMTPPSCLDPKLLPHLGPSQGVQRRCQVRGQGHACLPQPQVASAEVHSGRARLCQPSGRGIAVDHVCRCCRWWFWKLVLLLCYSRCYRGLQLACSPYLPTHMMLLSLLLSSSRILLLPLPLLLS